MDWLAAAPGIAALAGQVWAWVRRRSDARWLEQMKGDIRREVEAGLKAQESRLRVEAELRLRAHDRAWQLMRDLIAASWEAHRTVVDYAVAAANPQRDGRAVSNNYERASDALTKLNMLAVTAPPQYDVPQAIAKFREGFNATNELAIPDRDSQDVGRKVMAVRASVDDGLRAVRELCRTWNSGLWEDASSALLLPEK